MAAKKKNLSGMVRGSRGEDECKINAASRAQLDRIARYIRNNPHYEIIQEEKLSSPRIRTYYDDAKLRAFRAGIEIRIEKKEKGVWKMTVKTGGNKAGQGGTFRRQEHYALLKGPVPDLNTLPAPVKKVLQRVFNEKDLDDVGLLPLVEMVSRRLRILYHPDGDKKKTIEYAHDIVTGRTCTGKSWRLYQAELEKKAGAPLLATEQRRLISAFNFLTAENSSKPSFGFNLLAQQLKTREARHHLRDNLGARKFSIIRGL